MANIDPTSYCALSKTDVATILAALRYYQEGGQGDPDYRSDAIHEIATAGGEVISLDDDGINDLCERVNLCESFLGVKSA